jgi:hypothetical protein
MKILDLEKPVKMLEPEDMSQFGRDNSGGPDFDAYRAEFGDGGRTTGNKSYLAANSRNTGHEFTNPDWQTLGGDVPGFDMTNDYSLGDPVRVAKASFNPGYDIELRNATLDDLKRGYID